MERYSDEQLAQSQKVPLGPVEEYPGIAEYFKYAAPAREKLGLFLKSEGVAAVVVPSDDSRKNHGGQSGTIFNDWNNNFSIFSYQRAHATPVPLLVASIENYNRVMRLLAHVPVRLEANVDAKFTSDHEHGFNTIAEIPDTDLALKDQVVMLGAHLDSWTSGTGAADNGAGSIVAMEAMRILLALHVQPRRTIRIALWSGEEEGDLGSSGYVAQHFGTVPLAGDAAVPDFLRIPGGPPAVKPEQAKVSGYFNLDGGSGCIRGISTHGDLETAHIFTQWIAPLRDLGVTTVTNAGKSGGSDDASFDVVGIPGYGFTQDRLDYDSRVHHSNMDVYEALRPDDLRQAAVVEAIFVYNTAMREAMLPRKLQKISSNDRKSLAFPDAMQ